jgi:hypothetical protein
MSGADDEIETISGQLAGLKAALGSGYWEDGDVQRLQQRLRQAIGAYNAWAEDKLPAHQRARKAAAYERACAPLLWPGRADD